MKGKTTSLKKEKGEVWLTEKGAHSAGSLSGIDNLYAKDNGEFARHLIYALRAHKLLKEIKTTSFAKEIWELRLSLLDRATGRLMELTKLQGGLHQAIEAKRVSQTFSRDACDGFRYVSESLSKIQEDFRNDWDREDS